MRHHALPELMTVESLGQWITTNAKDTFTDSVKYIYTDEEISDFEKSSTRIGIQLIELSDIKKKAVELLMKGSEEDVLIEIPPSPGIKILSEMREKFDRMVKSGHEFTDTKIFGIPNEDGYMYYFDNGGHEISDRMRRLSEKENHQYNGFFGMDNLNQMQK